MPVFHLKRIWIQVHNITQKESYKKMKMTEIKKLFI